MALGTETTVLATTGWTFDGDRVWKYYSRGLHGHVTGGFQSDGRPTYSSFVGGKLDGTFSSLTQAQFKIEAAIFATSSACACGREVACSPCRNAEARG